MKKSSLVAMMLGTVSGLMFALGMCMALLPEWNAFSEGVVFGAIGLILGIITLVVWRRMEGKQPVKLNPRNVMLVVFGAAGALTLGIGMCFCMVWENIVLGAIIGIIGIIMLLAIIPLTKGIIEPEKK